VVTSSSPASPWYLDARFYAVLALGPLAWLLPEAGFRIVWWRLAYMALGEEILFRGLLHHGLLRMPFFGQSLGPLTLANIATSLVFVLAHFLAQPPIWALAVFFPSLIFGWLWDRYGQIVPCASVHLFYNLCFFNHHF
jgi:uncharacterized protein